MILLRDMRKVEAHSVRHGAGGFVAFDSAPRRDL